MGILSFPDFMGDSRHLTACIMSECQCLSFICCGISADCDLSELLENLREMPPFYSWLLYFLLIPVLRLQTGGLSLNQASPLPLSSPLHFLVGHLRSMWLINMAPSSKMLS